MSRPRTVLAIDCATLPASVACVADDGAVAELVHDDRRRSDAWLGAAVARCLDAADRSPAELIGVAVAIGPGTFTGIRVGIATGLGLAAPNGLPVAGITTLEALADIGQRRAERVVACVDARRDQVYAAIYERQGDAPTSVPVWGPVVCSPAEVQAALAARRVAPREETNAPPQGVESMVIGSGARLLEERDDLMVESGPVPLAAAIGRLVLRAWPRDLPAPGEWRPPEPLYLRPPDATPPRNPLLRKPPDA